MGGSGASHLYLRSDAASDAMPLDLSAMCAQLALSTCPAAVEVTALPFLPPAPSRCVAARSARSREVDEHERGGIHRASRGDYPGQHADVRTHMDLRGSDTARCPPSLRRWTAEVSSIARRSSTSELGYITRGGIDPFGRNSRTQVRTHARTRVVWRCW